MEDIPGEEDAERDTDIDDVLVHLEGLSRTVDDEDREEVRRAINMVESLSFGKRIEKYTTRDIAQAFVGSIVFSLPFLVEDGVYEIARHLLSSSFAGIPVFFAGNFAFVVAITAGLIYWSDIRDVRIHKPILGVVPRRLLGVLLISFGTSALTMSLWGRLDVPPAVALSRVSVVWTAAAVGASLGDILPGNTEGEDVNDIVRDLLQG
jgi:uncharacterized membrane protein